MPVSLELAGTDNRFVARAEIADAVTAALRSGRSVVLLGAPGVGKTRLAAECLRRLSDESAVVARLGDARDRDALVSRVAAAAGVWLSPASSPAEAEARLARALASRGPGVFVLDNYEQLPADADALVRDWLRASSMGWLVTSRRRLACDAEHIEVGPMETSAPSNRWSEAATLMRYRAEENAHVRIDESDREAIETLVAALDGLPLAIELAATRLAVLTPSQLLLRLDKRFSLLDGEEGGGLRAALEASLSLLSDDARQCLVACSVFRGGIRLEALEAMLGEQKDVLASLAALRNQSLLLVERVGAEYRYGLAHSVRDLVEERERDTPAWEAARAKHAEYWATAGEKEAEDPILGREIENLQAAFEWAQDGHPELCARLALTLSAPPLGLPYGVARELLSTMMAGPDFAGLPEALRGQLFYRRGTVRRYLADFAGAALDLEAAREIAERTNSRALLAEVLAGLGNACSARADWEGARRYLDRAMAAHPSPSFRPLVLAMIANTHSNEDAFDRAEPMLREAITLSDADHDVFAGAFARLSLGILLVERGIFDEAFGCLVDALSVLETSRSTRVMQARHLRAVALTHLARVKQETGDTAGALTDYHDALVYAEEAGVRRAEAFALHGLASLLLELGELRAADDRLREALPLIRENATDVEGAIVALQGVLFASRGAHDDAERFFRRAQALLDAHKRPVFATALAVLRGESDGAGPFTEFADVRLARRLRAVFSREAPSPPLFIAEDAAFFRSPESGEAVSLLRRKAVRAVLRALLEARLSRPGVPVSIDTLVAAGWPGEKVLAAAGAERVYAAIATLRRLGLRGVIAQEADGYLIPAKRAVLTHDPGSG
ncbi:MAG: tetratricopeptide repeat protein [Polyangiaceae bacterium]|nr:tetratricopeptide repeat protein [Polyangiaceae bacterium]